MTEMTDTSARTETNLTEAFLPEGLRGQELEHLNWDEYKREITTRRPTGQEEKEAKWQITRGQTGYIEEVEGERLSTSIATVVPIGSGLEKQFIQTSEEVVETVDRAEPQVNHILRVHFISQILTDLRQIQKYISKPEAAIYADSLLLTMRTMDEISPFDPFIEIVMAFHDALAYKNNWNKYSPDQYEGAYQILKEFVQKQNISSDTVEKAIMRFEKLGFETTPFDLDMEFKVDSEKD